MPMRPGSVTAQSREVPNSPSFGLDLGFPGAHVLPQGVGQGGLLVSVQAQDGAELGVAGEHQLQAVLLGLGHGGLVAVDPAAEVLDGGQCDEAAPFPGDPVLQPVFLAEVIDGRGVLRHQGAVLLPLPEPPRHGLVGIGVAAEIDAHDVVRRTVIQLRLVLGGDDVVGRGHHPGKIVSLPGVVGQAPEGKDLCHAAFLRFECPLSVLIVLRRIQIRRRGHSTPSGCPAACGPGLPPRRPAPP